MRFCLVLAWLIGMTCVMLQAGDFVFESRGDQNSVGTVKDFRRQDFARSLGSRRKLSAPIFGLNVAFPNNGDLLVVSEPKRSMRLVNENDEQDDESDDATNAGSDGASPLISIQIEKPQIGSLKPVPLDGATRDENSDDADSSKSKPPTVRSYFGWIAGTNDQLGILEFDSEPLSRAKYDPSKSLAFVVDTTFGAKWLSGPSITDLPPQLFNLLINIGSSFYVNDRTKIDAMISPGWFTDFSNKGIEAFRLPWHLVSYHRLENDWNLVLGVTDLSRDDIHYLPVVGVSYASLESPIEWDLVFPKPRIAWRFADSGKQDHLLYLSGELGGGSWAISRENRAYDVVTYRDYRMMLGLETRKPAGSASRIELGWIFNRAVEYRSDIGNYSPPDSLMIRISSDY